MTDSRKFSSNSLVHVNYHGLSQKFPMGRLLLKDRKIFFEYDQNFLKMGLELSPFKLPLRSGVITPSDNTFEGLFGLFNDSLPDGWGRLLLDRKLMSLGVNPYQISPLDRLCYVGSHGMGALSYEPENSLNQGSLINDLDEIYREIRIYQEGEGDNYIDDLIALGGSSAGARPKVCLNVDGKDWLIKFRSSTDPEDISTIEYAYHLMAIDAGLNVPKAKLFPSLRGGGYFGVRRFDRYKSKPIHMHTIAGLLHADHREALLDYEHILKATVFLTRNIKEAEKQFRHAVFNVLSHNRDDHSKNFSFLMDDTGEWRVSPAYDLTFSAGPAGQHSTVNMGEGKNPGLEHLLKLANSASINKANALEIITHVQSAIKKWETFAEAAGVSQLHSKSIAKALSQILINF